MDAVEAPDLEAGDAFLANMDSGNPDLADEPEIANRKNVSQDGPNFWGPCLTSPALGEPWASPRVPSGSLASTEQESLVEDSTESPESAAEAASGEGESGSVRVEIPECALLTPRSCYEPFDAGVPIMPESRALSTLASVQKRLQKVGEYIEYDLDEFAVYCDTLVYPCEMRSLHHLDTRRGQGLDVFFFDGILSIGGQSSVFVKKVPIVAMPIDNYGDLSKHTVRGKIWLQSELNRTRNVYYRLGKPVKEYARFFEPSLWVADLAKHFVDFLKVMGDHCRRVSIFQFRTTFRTWLNRAHKSAPAFVEWLAQHPREDFRTAVVANVAFLHKEAIGVLGEKSTYLHTIWSEIWDFSRYKEQPRATSLETVVTQYTYDCFRHMAFGDQLKVVPLSAKTQQLRNKLIQERRLELLSALHSCAKKVSTAAEERIKNIKAGDTISTHRDGEHSGTMWKREVSKGFDDVDCWFALVQRAHVRKNGRRVFDVIWYYRPVDTLCGLMKYPWNNELFLSDHCSCVERHKIGEDEVLGVHDVHFGGTSTTKAEFFCRQTYVHEERKWVTLEEKHMRCKHTARQRQGRRYRPGDTVLVHMQTASRVSEPCEVVSSHREEGKTTYRLRRLLRRREVDEAAGAAPNELVYSELLTAARKQRILGRCHVRVFPAGAEIPTPYDRAGVGGFFFMTHRRTAGADGGERCEPLEAAPAGLPQGPDPGLATAKLRGLDLFCGGGNFGRGLEDGGGIEMRWANDYDSRAVHTYMANAAAPETVAPFVGSVDDLQRLAMQGCFSRAVPAMGDVDFVSGGSPCPGFSRLTNDKTTAQQRKNQSLVAAFASFVDLYRPKYGLLENVPGIVQKRASCDQDVFSQLICAVFGLGYQTRFFLLDASACGSPQRRSRVFLAFAAPGLRLPGKPPVTHAHPPDTRAHSLGRLPTGEPMAEREMPPATPFGFVTAAEATADLPPILDAKPDICVPFPDHRVSVGMTRSQRTRISLIPTRPWGANFATAWFGSGPARAPGAGVLTPAERAAFAGLDGPRRPVADGAACRTGRVGSTRVNSGAYGRLVPHRLMETIVTTPNPGDAKNGRALHWREDRVLTIMEARRAQGIRNDEVLLGNPAVQYKMVGNSVAREVAVALGADFREAWVESLRTAAGGAGGELAAGQTQGVERRGEDVAGDGDDDDDDDGDVTILAPQLPAVLIDDMSASSDHGLGVHPSRDPSTPATSVSSASSSCINLKRPRSSPIVEIPAPKRSRLGSLLGRTVVTLAGPEE